MPPNIPPPVPAPVPGPTSGICTEVGNSRDSPRIAIPRIRNGVKSGRTSSSP